MGILRLSSLREGRSRGGAQEWEPLDPPMQMIGQDNAWGTFFTRRHAREDSAEKQ